MDDPDFNVGHVISAEETDEGLLVHGALDIEDTAPTSIKDAKDRAADRTEKGLTEITPASLRKIIDAAARHLAPFKVPKEVVLVDELPRNQSGKLLKRELRSR